MIPAVYHALRTLAAAGKIAARIMQTHTEAKVVLKLQESVARHLNQSKWCFGKCREPTIAFAMTSLGALESSSPGVFAVGEAALRLGNQLGQLRTKCPSMEGAHHWRSLKSCPRGDIPAPWCPGQFGGSDGDSEGDAGLRRQPCSCHPLTLCSLHLHFGPQ